MRFYLGTHRPGWLGTVAVPLFISRRQLAGRRALAPAAAPWCLDSGGFTELSMYGAWSVTPSVYAEEIRRYEAEIGLLDWAAPMDWMCEPGILVKTGGTVAEHQASTIRNYLDLAALGAPVIPVLQGWGIDDYLRHIDAYEAAGVGLEGIVGVGSVCRRGQDGEVERILGRLVHEGLRFHAFGVRGRPLAHLSDRLASADSMAWSYNARRNAPLPGCTHRNCANCLRYALRWRANLLNATSQPRLEGVTA